MVFSQKGVNFFCYSPNSEFVIQCDHGILNQIKRNARSKRLIAGRTCGENWGRNLHSRNVGKHKSYSGCKDVTAAHCIFWMLN